MAEANQELQHESWCGARSRWKDMCRREPGHEGDHVSRLDRWPQRKNAEQESESVSEAKQWQK